MKFRLSAALVSAAILSVGISVSAHAQQPTRRDTLRRDTTARQDTTRRESRGEVAMPPTATTLTMALDSTATHVKALHRMTTISPSQVTIVDATPLVTGSESESLNAAMMRNRTALDSLHAAISANATLRSALDNASTPIAVNDVIAANVDPTGRVTLFYRKHD